MLYPEMVDQFGDNFRIGIAFEHVSSLLQQSFHFLVIRHDTCIQDDRMWRIEKKISERDAYTYITSITIMNNDEGMLAVRTLRMGIYLRWNTMSRPSRVSDADVVLSFRLKVKIGACE